MIQRSAGSPWWSSRPLIKTAFGVLILCIACGYYFSRPGRVLQRFMLGCVGCHVRVTLELDGIAASRLSKGTHPVNEAKIRPLKNLPRKDWQFYKKEDLTGESCALCHVQQFHSWQKSAHGRAFNNEIFQHAFHRDRDGWCMNCHAPLWEPEQMDAAQIADHPDMQAVYAQGVTCVVCHLRDGQIVSSTDYKEKQDKLYHPVRYDPDFGTEKFCAGCHQFNFTESIHPVVVYEGDQHPMQNVVHEFKQSNGSLYPESCAGCHLHEGDHGLKSEAEPDLSKKLELKIAWQKHSESTNSYKLDLRIAIPRLAHHFPTGDLFRILSFYVYDQQGQKQLQYDFRKEVRVVDRVVIQDTTLKPLPGQKGAHADLSFNLTGTPVRCRLVYRLQGTIDAEIEQDFKDKAVLYDVLYDGPCQQ